MGLIELRNYLIYEVGSLFLLRMLCVGGHFSPGEWQYDNCQCFGLSMEFIQFIVFFGFKRLCLSGVPVSFIVS